MNPEIKPLGRPAKVHGSPPAGPGSGGDDLATAAALGGLAFVLTTLFHEAVGHGGVSLLLHHGFVLFPVSTQTSFQSAVMTAAGPAANALAGTLLLLLSSRIASPHLRYLAWLTAAFSLFNFAGYALFGALTGFGDWAVLLDWPSAGWPLRLAVALPAAGLYVLSLRRIAWLGATFLRRRLLLTSYLAAGATALAAAALSHQGLAYLGVAAAASLGAGWGLLAIHDQSRGVPAQNVRRSIPWLAAGTLLILGFIAVVGPGLSVGN